MISITCTHCRANLTIDDAFAGGVCRCQFCGTIQTVPAKGVPTKAAATSTAKPQAVPASKTLYQNKARSRGSNGTGLDDLASVVASSGLADSGLSSRRHTAADEPAKQKRLLPILLIACAVLVVILGIVLAVVVFRGRGTWGSGNPTSESGQPGGNSSAGASFCGIPLHTGSTIFLLDRGNSISDQFDTVKAACFKAVDQFGPARKFQVILWDNDSSGAAEFPVGQMQDATAGNTTQLRQYFQDAIATGRSHLSGVLKEAASRNPQEIVIVTGKGADDLDEDDAAVLQSMVGKNIRIDAVQVYPVSPSPNKVLQEVSRQTGGQFRNVSGPELRDFAH
jgi:hypothetical protein